MQTPAVTNIPLLVCVAGMVACQLAQKFWPRTMHPLRLLAASYGVAVVIALVVSLLVAPPAAKDAPAPLTPHALWPVLLLGLATVAVEAGYLALFRDGAAVSKLGPYAGSLATAALAAIGVTAFHEHIAARGWAGLALSCAGSAPARHEIRIPVRAEPRPSKGVPEWNSETLEKTRLREYPSGPGTWAAVPQTGISRKSQQSRQTPRARRLMARPL